MCTEGVQEPKVKRGMGSPGLDLRVVVSCVATGSKPRSSTRAMLLTRIISPFPLRSLKDNFPSADKVYRSMTLVSRMSKFQLLESLRLCFLLNKKLLQHKQKEQKGKGERANQPNFQAL